MSWENLINYLPADSNGNIDIPISKSFTRCSSLLCAFNQADHPTYAGKTKRVPTAASESFEWALHLGSERMPQNDVRGIGETWYRTMQALGLYESLAHSTSIDEDSYKSDQMILGLDMEKLAMVSASGKNLSSGQTIFLKCKGLGSTSPVTGVVNTTTDVPRIAMVMMHHEKIAAIHDTVCEIFD